MKDGHSYKVRSLNILKLYFCVVLNFSVTYEALLSQTIFEYLKEIMLLDIFCVICFTFRIVLVNSVL